MVYIRILFATILIYIKSIIKRGKWYIEFWQNIHPTVKITTLPGSIITLKKKTIIERYGNIYVGKCGQLYIGENVYFNQGNIISCKEKISIGSHCLFGPGVKIYDNNHIFKRNVGVLFEHSTGSIEIGENCWIASNVVILKNTKIGDNCVIGANSVISGNIPDNSIVKCNGNLIIEEMRK